MERPACKKYYSLWLWVPAFAGTTDRYDLAFPRRGAPELCRYFGPHEKQGAGKAGCWLTPAVSCARNAQRYAHEHTGVAEAYRPSLRSGFTAYSALSPATNSSCHRRRRIDDS